nr:replication protein [uncultured Desulfuromonas sp.]
MNYYKKKEYREKLDKLRKTDPEMAAGLEELDNVSPAAPVPAPIPEQQTTASTDTVEIMPTPVQPTPEPPTAPTPEPIPVQQHHRPVVPINSHQSVRYLGLELDLLELLAKGVFSHRETRVLLVILRHTAGFNRPKWPRRSGDNDKMMALKRDIAAATNIVLSDVTKTLKSLISKNVITMDSDGITYNYNYQAWNRGDWLTFTDDVLEAVVETREANYL